MTTDHLDWHHQCVVEGRSCSLFSGLKPRLCTAYTSFHQRNRNKTHDSHDYIAGMRLRQTWAHKGTKVKQLIYCCGSPWIWVEVKLCRFEHHDTRTRFWLLQTGPESSPKFNIVIYCEKPNSNLCKATIGGWFKNTPCVSFK